MISHIFPSKTCLKDADKLWLQKIREMMTNIYTTGKMMYFSSFANASSALCNVHSDNRQQKQQQLFLARISMFAGFSPHRRVSINGTQAHINIALRILANEMYHILRSSKIHTAEYRFPEIL